MNDWTFLDNWDWANKIYKAYSKEDMTYEDFVTLFSNISKIENRNIGTQIFDFASFASKGYFPLEDE